MAKKSVEVTDDGLTVLESPEQADADKMLADKEYMASLTIAERLALQPRRQVRIRKPDGIKQVFVDVWVNGHRFQIMRGVDVEVPQTVYDILVEAGEI